LAGGIGVTPFRSITKYLIDKNQQCDIVLFYTNKYASEIVYKDVFDEAQIKLGMKTIYAITDETKVPADWTGKVGRVTAEMVTQEVPDFKDRIFYLSGPHAMITAFEELLMKLGVPRTHIHTDFFPGFV
jgi:ferredoxin-NADP reductase